jgi:hypothetical protein
MNAVNKKPGESKFSDKFIERSRIHPLEHNILCSISQGADSCKIIEQLIGNLNETHKELRNIKLRGFPPIYVAVSESELEKLKTRINETND